METKNVVITVLAIALLAVGGIYLYNNAKSPFASLIATSTPQTGSVGSTPTPSSSGGGVAVRTADVPVVRTNTDVTASNSTAVVNGTVNPNGAITSYWYEYGEGTALGTRTTGQSVGSGFSAIPAPGYITGLKANTLYYFRLSAENRFARVNGTTYSFRTNSNPPPVGVSPAVRTIAATAVARTGAILHGQVDPNGSDTRYWFEYGISNDLGSVTDVRGAGSGNGSIDISVTLSGLEPQTKYFFRLNAQNQYGTVNGTLMSFTTSGPSAPGKPSANTNAATAVGDSSARLHGHVNPNGADTDYWFEYSEDSLLGSILGTATTRKSLGSGTTNTAVNVDLDNLSNDTKYFFRVVAQNQYGTVRGDQQSFTTKK